MSMHDSARAYVLADSDRLIFVSLGFVISLCHAIVFMMSRIRDFFKLYHLAFLSGVLIGTSYIPFFPWAIAFCYAPLWYFLIKKNPNLRQTLWAGWWTQFILTLIGFHWVAFVAHEYGYLPWPAAILILFIFAACMHLYIPISIAVGYWLSRRLKLGIYFQVFVYAGLLALGEIFWPSIFKWNMGYPLLWARSPLAQWADVIGFQGLSFAVYLVNAILLAVIFLKNYRRCFTVLSALALCLATLSYYGGNRQKAWKPSAAEELSPSFKNLKILAVQANIGNFEKYEAEKGRGFQQQILEDFFELTRVALATHPQSDLILWPESAVPEYLDNFASDRKIPTLLRQFVHSIQKPLIAGAYSKDPPEQTTPRKEYNGVFLFDENGLPLSPPYRKTQLLIFGEYIPLVEEFPILAKYNPGGSGFGRGPGPSIMAFRDLNLGMQICYESLDPLFSATLAKKQADLLVNITNDSWFGPRFEPYQNLWMTLARAIETRRPLVRATNTGITTAIAADGTVFEQSPIYAKWFGQFSIPIRKNAPLTTYTQIAPFLWMFIAGFLALVLVLGKLNARNDGP